MIGVDWGTTNFRAFRIDGNGSVYEKRALHQGILNIAEGRFEEALLAHIGDWVREGEQHVLLSGMIGSKQGWIETNYLACPAGLEEIAGSLVQVPMSAATALLVPGVKALDADNTPEVMRGEEVEIIGLLSSNADHNLVCLPGTHSKWVILDDKEIVSFSTYMTGEIFDALCRSTILSKSVGTQTAADDVAFVCGVARSQQAGGLLHHMFGVRTLGLMKLLETVESASYLSGLLIGHEVRAALPTGGKVHLVGSTKLCALYARAIELCGGSATMERENAAARGHAAIGRRLGWT